ncbi:MAG: hypothetical protein FJY55_13085 [Betaproteobacteria bacterium]|nr:hypothetical protein [Betaproteobacteria bacterium]
MLRRTSCSAGLALFAVMSLAGPAHAAPEARLVTLPTVIAVAVTASSKPFGSRADQIAAAGYVEREYLQAGDANVYAHDAEGFATVRDGTVKYVTRFIVRMPSDPARFSGTVWVELLNPTARYDQDVFGALSMEHYLRRGDIYVGLMVKPVAARTIAANYDLKNTPKRYQTLSFPNPRPDLCAPPGNGTTSFKESEDGLAWDIVSQAGAVLRSPVGPLAGYRVQRVFASGYSQTANYLVTYINAVLPTVRTPTGAPVFDGYLLGARTANWTPINQCAPVFAREAPQQRLRDAGVPVINVNTETDVPGTAAARRADDARFRLWEVAGAGHSNQDSRGRTTADRDFKDTPFPALVITCVNKITSFPSRYALNAAQGALDRWVRDGVAPFSAERLQFANNAIARDVHGNALGGLRLPSIDVPLSEYQGSNKFAGQGANFCFLLGSEIAFDEAKLKSLYPTPDNYLQKLSQAAQAAVSRGILEKVDAEELLANARLR